MASPGGVEVGRVSVRVVPDTSRLGTDLRLALDHIEAQVDLAISTSIDTTLLDSQARAAVEQAQLAAGDLDIKTRVDTSQVHEAESALSGASSAAQAFSSSLGAVATAAIILGPALIPVAAALAGLVATLIAPLAIVGGGLTLFGVIAGFTISETNKQFKAIAALQTKLDGLTKGTQAYADTAAELRAQQKALTPAQVAFGAAIASVRSAFGELPKGIVLDPLIEGLKLLARVIPLATPILKVVSGVISDMLGKFDGFARSPGFKDFVTAFAKQLGPDLRAFATIAGNIFQGLFGLFGAFNKQLSGSVLKSLEDLTGKFADWGKTIGSSKGFRSFVSYLRQVGPKVTDALAAIAGAAVAIVTAFAPVGGVVLDAITGMADAISKVPAGVLETLAGALVGIVAASKLLGPLSGLISGIIAAPEVAIVVGLIAALVGGFILLYQNSKPLRHILGDLGDFFRTNLLPLIQDAAKKVVPALKDAIHDISKTIHDNKGFLETFGKAILILGAAGTIAAIEQLVAGIRLIGKAFKFGVTAAHIFADVFLAQLIFLTKGVGLFVAAVLAQFGSIVDAAAAAFGFLPKIGGKIKAAQQNFHDFENSVNGNIDGVATQLQDLRTQIDAVGNSHPTFKVTAETLEAVRRLEALQAFRIKDKSFSVKMELELDRAVGPGGGIGHPLGTNNGGAGARSVAPPDVRSGDGGGAGRARTGSSGALVHADTIQVRDVDDLLRKTQNLLRSRAGGGVIFAGAGA